MTLDEIAIHARAQRASAEFRLQSLQRQVADRTLDELLAFGSGLLELRREVERWREVEIAAEVARR